ncbi:MAG TPA: AsmA family protein, partial [Methylomirabilota bacterium]|nr:AsmA family protein [Methylomirabilota bacterium]
MTVRRIIAWLAGLIGLAVVLLLLAALLLPRVLDSQAVRERIRAFVSSKTDADLAISKIDLTWFPRPVVTMRGISVSFGKQVTGTIQSLTARPSVAGLLRRKFDTSRVELSGVALSLALQGEQPLDIDAVEGQLRALLTSLATQAPRLIVVVSDSSVELRSGKRPSLIITNLNGRLRAPPSALEIHLRSGSNAFDSLQLELSIAADTLATTGRARFERLRLPEAFAAISPRPLPFLGSGDASLDVALTSAGFRKLQAAIEASAPSVTLVRGQRSTVLDGVALKAAVGEDQGIVRAAIERLDVRSPR